MQGFPRILFLILFYQKLKYDETINIMLRSTCDTNGESNNELYNDGLALKVLPPLPRFKNLFLFASYTVFH